MKAQMACLLSLTAVDESSLPTREVHLNMYGGNTDGISHWSICLVHLIKKNTFSFKWIVFTWRHHFLKSKNERATKVFVLVRHKRRYIYICLQFYSSIACFVWNPEHFEFQGYGGTWHKAMIEFVEKYILIPWFWAFLEVRTLRKVLM